MNVPASVTFVAERISKELFCPDGDNPKIESNIRPHQDPSQGWIIEMTLKPPHTGMLTIYPTIRRLGHGSVAWDMERDEIIITGMVNNIPVGVLISRVTEVSVRPSRN